MRTRNALVAIALVLGTLVGTAPAAPARKVKVDDNLRLAEQRVVTARADWDRAVAAHHPLTAFFDSIVYRSAVLHRDQMKAQSSQPRRSSTSSVPTAKGS